MADPNPETLRRIFDLAFEASGDARNDILDRECAGNQPLRQRVEAMLAGASDERFLADPTITRSAAGGDFEAISTTSSGEELGQRIGPYKLLDKIGEGGFGSVFLAEQERPVRRRVALKLIKLGMDTRQVVARFEQERQALAMMDHAHVARVFDAGATEAGRPYFVMEFCAGEAITQYCDTNNLSIADRLGLFVQVCEAVQHAHQKGLIHRDIKPSNILVTTQDDRPHAKVIDFGIAKATAAKLTEMTVFTEHKQLIGTPEYMSPEQAEGSLDIDTRTDVYSLGVLLYELMTGNTPFDGKSLRSAAYGEIQRIIREVEPPKPSTRLRQSSDTLANVAARRNVEPKRLGTIVRGELDWIVMTALEKDRRRRYDSPNALGSDIKRYLAGEAVTAAPPSRVYVLRKFIGRNKGAAAATAAIGIALLAGICAFAWQAKIARTERDRAVLAEAQTAQRARQLQKVSDFQTQMISQVDPAAAGMRLSADVRARFDAALIKTGVPATDRATKSAAFAEDWSRLNSTDVALELINSTILAPALVALDRQFASEPELHTTLGRAISDRYVDLGLYDEALAAFDKVLDTQKQAGSADDTEALKAQIAKCKVLILTGKSTPAESTLRSIISQQKSRLGADNLVIISAEVYLAEALIARSQYAEAESLLRADCAARRRLLGDDHDDTLMAVGDLSMALRGAAQYAEAESLTREVLDRRRRLFGEANNYTLNSYNNLAVINLEQGHFQEAANNFQKVVEGRRRLLGEAHRDTVLATSNLSAALGRLQKHAEAEAIQRDLLERTRRVLGPDHPDTLMVESNLATSLINLGKFAEAEPMCRDSLDRRLRIFGPSSVEAVTGNNVMAFVLRRENRDAEAEPYLRAAFDASSTAWGIDHPERMVLLLNMGSLSCDTDRLADAEQYYREAIERCTRTLGPTHPYSIMAVQGLGEAFFVEKNYPKCIDVLSHAESNFRTAAAANDDGSLRTLLLRMGKSRLVLRDFAAAEPNISEAYSLFLAAQGPNGKITQNAARAMVDLYDKWNAAAPDVERQAKAAEWRARVIQPASTPASGPATRTSG